MEHIETTVRDIAAMPRCAGCDLPLVRGGCPYCEASALDLDTKLRLYRLHELAFELLGYVDTALGEECEDREERERASVVLRDRTIAACNEAEDVLTGLEYRGVGVTIRRVLLNCFLGTASVEARIVLAWLASHVLIEELVTPTRVLQVARLHLEAAR